MPNYGMEPITTDETFKYTTLVGKIIKVTAQEKEEQEENQKTLIGEIINYVVIGEEDDNCLFIVISQITLDKDYAGLIKICGYDFVRNKEVPFYVTKKQHKELLNLGHIIPMPYHTYKMYCIDSEPKG